MNIFLRLLCLMLLFSANIAVSSDYQNKEKFELACDEFQPSKMVISEIFCLPDISQMKSYHFTNEPLFIALDESAIKSSMKPFKGFIYWKSNFLICGLGKE